MSISTLLLSLGFIASISAASAADVPHESPQQVRNRAGMEEIDPHSLSTVEVECRNGNETLFSVPPCKDGGKGFMEQVERNFLKQVQLTNLDLYDGNRRDALTGAVLHEGIPACNLMAGEVEKNFRGESCKDFCNINVETPSIFSAWEWGDVSVTSDRNSGGCQRERSYFRGIRVQITHFFKEQVINEFRNKNIKLLDIEGSKPCAGVAADALSILRAQEDTVAGLVEISGSVEKAAATKCPVGSNAVQSNSGAGIDAKIMAACHMKSASMQIVNAWTKLLGCEYHWRTFNEFEKKFGSPDQYLGATQAIGERCKNEVCQLSLGCTDSKRSRQVTECYRREILPFIKSLYTPYSTPKAVDLPAKHSSTNFPKNSEEGSTMAFSFFALGTLLRGKKKRKYLTSVNLLLGLFLVSAFQMGGCGCSEEEPAQPCPSAETRLVERCTGLIQGRIPAQGYTVNVDGMKEYSIERDGDGNAIGPAVDYGLAVSEAAAINVFIELEVPPNQAVMEASAHTQDEIEKVLKDKFLSLKVQRSNMTEQSTLYQQAKDACHTYIKNRSFTPKALEKLKNTFVGMAFLNLDTSAEHFKLEQGDNNYMRWNDLEPSCLNPSPPNGGGPIEGPDAGAPVAVTGAATDIVNAKDIMGGEVAFNTKPKDAKKGGAAGSRAATAGTKMDGKRGAGTDGGGGPKSGESGGSGNAPMQVAKGGSDSGGSTNAGLSVPGGGLGGGAADAGSGAAAETAMNSEATGFDSAGQGGGGAAKANSNPFGSMFGGGAGAGGGLGAGGVSGADFGAKGGASEIDLESYLATNGKVSLFEIVNRRMDKWGTNASSMPGATKH